MYNGGLSFSDHEKAAGEAVPAPMSGVRKIFRDLENGLRFFCF